MGKKQRSYNVKILQLLLYLFITNLQRKGKRQQIPKNVGKFLTADVVSVAIGV